MNAPDGDDGTLTPDERVELRRQLLVLRGRASGAVTFLKADSLKPMRAEDEDEDSMDYDFQLRVAGSSQDLVKDIDDALRRMEDGTYGICEATGQPIAKARLKAIPHARFCLEAQAEQEQGRVRRRPRLL